MAQKIPNVSEVSPQTEEQREARIIFLRDISIPTLVATPLNTLRGWLK